MRNKTKVVKPETLTTRHTEDSNQWSEHQEDSNTRSTLGTSSGCQDDNKLIKKTHLNANNIESTKDVTYPTLSVMQTVSFG